MAGLEACEEGMARAKQWEKERELIELEKNLKRNIQQMPPSFFEYFSNLPKWFTNLWILVVASIYGIKGTQIFRNGGKK